jgi:type IV pilus assembly protein PilE
MRTHPPRQRGFTLIELMIVVAVVAILAGIAYPSYRDAVLKGRRAQGRAAVLELLQQQERYMTQHNSYMTFSNSGGATSPSGVPFKTFAGDNANSTPYQLLAELCPGSTSAKDCIMVVAHPAQADPEVNDLWATSTGARNCTGTAQTIGAPPKVCWP